MQYSARRIVRKAVVTAAAGAAIIGAASAASAAGTSTASPQLKPAGYVTVEGCSSVTGTTIYNPGLTTTARNQTAQLSATIGGCSNAFTGAAAGTGSLVANLSGASSTAAVSLRGTFTISWPAASGLNPSTGTLGVSGPNAQGVYTVSGTVTAGAFTGSPVNTSVAVVGTNAGANGTNKHPVTSQQVVNAAPLNVSRNNW
jgi:hypothetical protein